MLSLNKSLADDQHIANYAGMNSAYSTEFGLLNSSLPSIDPSGCTLEANITID